ncbi:3'-5' exonuclease [Salipaludibacillus sp. CF4.18]|uniref:3'-5' exonuclease n=1 Tax=Salipaludibacillus sp. CF4.18 TaxID=3373081 RepID=UPI003EE677F5
MEISVLKIIKYLIYDRFHFEKSKDQWIENHQETYDVLCEKMNQSAETSFPADERLQDLSFTVFDLETTGFFPRAGDEIISIGAVKITVSDLGLSKQFYQIVSPIKKPSNEVKLLIDMTQKQIDRGKAFPESLNDFLSFADQSILVAYPASFDVPFLQELSKRWNMPTGNLPHIDCHKLAQYLYPNEKNTLDHLVKKFGIVQQERHHALNDALMTAEVFQFLIEELIQRGITTLQEYRKAMNIK